MKISVIIPCFNLAGHLTRAVRSIQKESDRTDGVEAVEIIVSDDGSTDETTREILSNLEVAGSAQVIRVGTNRGAAAARNAGAAAASGEWLAFLDGDDWWESGALDFYRQTIIEHPGVEWICGNFDLLWQQGDAIVRRPYAEHTPSGEQILARGRDFAHFRLLDKPVAALVSEGLSVSTSTVFVRRHLFMRIGGFDPSLRQAEDVHLWIRLASVTDLAFVKEVVGVYYQRLVSLTNQGTPPGKWDRRAMKLLMKDPALKGYRHLLRERVVRMCHVDVNFHIGNGAASSAVMASLEAPGTAPWHRYSWWLVASAARSALPMMLSRLFALGAR